MNHSILLLVMLTKIPTELFLSSGSYPFISMVRAQLINGTAIAVWLSQMMVIVVPWNSFTVFFMFKWSVEIVAFLSINGF